MQPFREFQIYKNVESYLKVYPTFERLIIFETSRKVRVAGYEPRFKEKKIHRASHPIFEAENKLDSLRRSKTRLSDIVLSNDFQFFATFTFAKNRTDLVRLKKSMSKYLENTKNRYGDFKYVIVPEFHRDGKSLHFHALFTEFPAPITYSGHNTKSGEKIYNIKNYTLGFNTLTKIENKEKVSSYVKKYITKTMVEIPGQKRYWCSRDLYRPLKIENPGIKLDDYSKLFSKNGLLVYHKDVKINEAL